MAKQPPGLRVLFLTETWERFSFYGMQALLIFYLIKHFLLNDAEAYAAYGRYVALVYTAPVIGGAVADRWLGLRKAVLLGAILLMFGHFGMALDGQVPHWLGYGIDGGGSSLGLKLTYLSLTLIAFGTGFLKPNITAILGRLYEEEDTRRDSGFTLFFVGINLGGTLAALIVGYLGQGIAWRYGFGAAGVGMSIGLATFLAGRKHLQDRAEPPDPSTLQRRIVGAITLEHTIYAAGFCVVLLAWQVMQIPGLLTGIVAFTILAIVAWLSRYAAQKFTPQQRAQLISALLVIFASMLFFIAVLQDGTTINLFIDRHVNKVVFGYRVQASQFMALSGIFVIGFAPLFSALWMRLDQSGSSPGSISKIATGTIINGMAFAVLATGGLFAQSATSISAGWIVLAYALISIGQLLVVPTGLSLVTRLSAPQVSGLMVGLWFLAVACAGVISPWIAEFAAMTPGQSLGAGLRLYQQLFVAIGLSLTCMGVLLFLARPAFRKLMYGIE